MSFSNPAFWALSLVALFVFLILFFGARKLSKIERDNLIFTTENFRILFTFFAVFGAIFNIRSHVTKIQRENHVEYAEAYGALAKDSFNFKKGHYCFSYEFLKSRYKETDKEAKIVCDFLTANEKLFHKVDILTIYSLWSKLSWPKNCAKCIQVKNDIDNALAPLKNEEEENSRFEAIKGRGVFEEMLFMFSPWLIAIICSFSLFKIYNDKFLKNLP